VIAQLPMDVATYLLNEKRDGIRQIEERDDVQVILVSNPDLETPNYSIRRVRQDETVLPENTGASYTLVSESDGIDESLLGLSTHQAACEKTTFRLGSRDVFTLMEIYRRIRR